MRRLILLCLFGLLITGAVAVASPVLGRPAATTWFAAAAHVRKASAHRSVKPEKRGSSLVHTPLGRAASAASSAVLFGEQSIESGRGWDSSGHAQAFPFTNTSTGSATTINVYLRYANRATTLIAGLYAARGGHAGALVAVGSLTSPKAGAWNSVPVRSASVTPGTYWVAVLGTGGGLSFRQGPAGSCNSQMSSSSDLEALPSTWAGGTAESGCPISAYVAGTLTPASAGSGTTTTTGTPTGAVTLPPVNTGAPAISGGAVDGDTLTSSNGSWLDSPTSYAYQWQDCTTGSLGLMCTNISGATDSSYTLTESDVGDTVRVLVTAGNSAGSTSAASAETAAVTLPPAPANTAAPVVTGSPAQGQTLSTSNGTWSNSPENYSYAWQDCDSSGANCTDISNASASTYTLTGTEVGHTIRSVVTAANDGGSDTASSAPTAAVTMAPPVDSAAPAISGSAVQGQTLTTSNGSWSGSPASYLYVWEDCSSSGASCTDISNASATTYTLTSTDVGHTIRSVVTASNAGGANSASSAQTAAVTSATPAAPTNTAVPAISGTAQQGQTLTASSGSWSGSPTSYGYQWQDCSSSTSCTNISGATSSSYTLQSSDVGKTVDVVVTATNAGGSKSATSAQTAAVASATPAAPANTAVPAVSGTAQQGDTLTTSNGSWSGSPTGYAYAWEDCNSSGASCAKISNATASTYTLASSDVGGTIRSVITATNAGGSSSASSAQTATVTSATPAAPANTAVPTISGTAQQGNTLTASNGSWSGSPTSYAYHWQDCTSSTSCTNITGATSSTYTLQSSDVGDTIDIVVTASNAGGSSSATSALTAAVTSSGSSDPPPGELSCNLNATTSSFATQIADATPGQVVCLASGDYSSFTGTSKSAPGITITAAPGATVTFNSGMSLNLSSVQNFTLDGTGGGGTMTVGGALNLSTSGGLQSKALNLTFQNIAFTASSNAVMIEGPENSNIVFNRDTFIDGNAACNGGSPSTVGAEFMLDYGTSGGTTPSGVTLENSVFVAPGDLWNPNRAMETVGSPLSIENNVFAGFLDHTESASCNHIDTLQLYAGSNSTDGNVTFTGNLCYDDYNCFAAWDGTSDNTITDNACFDIEQNCIDLYSDTSSVINHNTQQTGGADPSGCGYLPNTQGCNSSTLLENSNKSGDRTTTGETYTNNLDQHGPNVESGSLTTNTNNMWSGASSPNINGTATFTGGNDPLSWTGFQLTSGSTGHNSGNDGQNVGIRASAGGPPTGGGSAPVNTAAPSLSGTATEGDTLTTTNGTWTTTGNVPTTTTYQWWDCSTSTFSTGSCTPIQPQTAPTSANNTTYTLQSSDVGKYIFSEITTTNANGQINATSKPTGPITS